MMKTIDLNADVGTGFEGENSSHDEKIIKRITSANIACGFHGGDPAVMQRSVDFALKYGVALGAHIGLPGMLGFEMGDFKVSPKRVYSQVLYQLGALQAFALAQGKRVQHVKLHGALYEQSISDLALARSIVDAVAGFDSAIILLGPSNSELLKVGSEMGLQVATERSVENLESLKFDVDSITVAADLPYALRLLDELRLICQKEGISLAPLLQPPSQE